MEKVKKGVRLEHISKIYQDPKTGKDFYAVKDNSLVIEPGEFVTLLGPSGCGKTTTLRIIAGLEAPDGGRVLLQGSDVTDWEPNRRNVNTVFQSYALFPHMNVARNIGYGLRLKKTPKDEIRRRVDEMLSLVQLPGYGARMPSQLSGGQRQRVAIARALLADCPVLVLDEATSALDSESEALVQDALSKLMRGRTCIVVAHRLSTVASLDRIVVLDHGKITEDGPHADLVAANGEYANLWNRQTGAYLK